MVNTKIRLIICFVAEDGESLYSQKKQDWVRPTALPFRVGDYSERKGVRWEEEVREPL